MKKIVLSVFIFIIGIVSFVTLPGCTSSKTAKIGIPNDATNQGRAIKLLESAGLIDVDPAAGFTPELKDITKYHYQIKIIPTDADLLSSLLEDYDACIINGQFAAAIGLVPSKDALIIEKQIEGSSNPFINVIAARTEEKDSEIYQKIVNAYRSQEVAEFLLQKYNETYYPAFSYEEFTPNEDFVNEITNYTSTKDGKEVVVVGVCGSSNEQWKVVQKILDEQNENIYIELKEFSAYDIPNDALNSGEIDLNAFQHYSFLNNEIAAKGYNISAIGETLIAPLSLYSKKVSTLDEIKANFPLE